MKEIFINLLLSFLFLLFLYFGYRDDFKRDPKEFWKAVLGVPTLILSAVLGIPFFTNLTRKRTEKEAKKK